VDAAGNAYVAGFIGAFHLIDDFPTRNPVQATFGGGIYDAFVAKLNPTGSALVYATYLGGSADDVPGGIAVDAAGNAYVIGTTTSTNFPTASPFQGSFHGGGDAFVAKIPDIGPLTYTVPDDGQPHTLVLGVGGATLQLLDNGSAVRSRLLANSTGVVVTAAGGAPVVLNVDNSAGLIALPDGVRFDGGPGGGVLLLTGTPGVDVLTLTPAYATLNGALTLRFTHVSFLSAFGGPADSAVLFDGPGDDLFVATPSYAYLQAGSSLNIVSGLGAVRAISSAGSDLALLLDSAGDDVFVARPAISYLAGSGFLNVAVGFAQVRGVASGGRDAAYLFDSSGDDSFRGTPTSSYLSGAGFLSLALNFPEVTATAGAGGFDFADLYDSPGNDSLTGLGSLGVLAGPGFGLTVNGFASVRATSRAGGTDYFTLNAIDYIFQPLGNWQ
jgi:hypothetical protein